MDDTIMKVSICNNNNNNNNNNNITIYKAGTQRQ